MLSVVIPAYNEGHHIYNNLLRVHNQLEESRCEHEIIVVNDGSRDSTAEEAKKALEEVDVIKLVSYSKNMGKGYAIIEGIKNSSQELVTFLDGDLDIPPGQIKLLIDKLYETGADVVIQSKRHKKSIIEGYTFKRKFLSLSYNLIVRMLFNLPVSDTQVGLKLYRREVIDKILPKLLVKRYAADLEQLVLIRKYGYKIAECPVHIRYKPNGDTIGIRDIARIAWDTAAIYYRLNITKYYDKPTQF